MITLLSCTVFKSISLDQAGHVDFLDRLTDPPALVPLACNTRLSFVSMREAGNLFLAFPFT